MALRLAHIAFGSASAAVTQLAIPMPAIPKIALDVRIVKVMVSDFGFNTAYAVSHSTSEDPVQSGDPGFLQDVRDPWILGYAPAGSSSGGAGGWSYDITYFEPRDMPVAGPQRFLVGNNAGFTVRFSVSIYYEQRNISLPDWTLLKSRTSHEQD